MTKLLKTVLLFALPASGKSEVRKYLDGLTADQCRDEFHMGQTLQLDDYPYVHFMHRIDDELMKRGHRYLFYKGQDRPFQEPYEWGTLIQLLNEDYDDLLANRTFNVPSAAQLFFDRMDNARSKVGLPRVMRELPWWLRLEVGQALEAECREELENKNRTCSQSLEGKTVVIEAARGGPLGAGFPLKPPSGYQYAFSVLSEKILEQATVLYIWVTPEESRRKNQERAKPDAQGSILHHSAPLEVMIGDYGCDDMEYLISISDKPNTVKVERIYEETDANGERRYALRTYQMPIGRFDNRQDKTSFIRKSRQDWTKEEVSTMHTELKNAFAAMVE